MSESDMTTQEGARVLLLPATLRRAGGGRRSAGASYYPRLRLACGAGQGGCPSRADRLRGWLYTSWAAGIAARWEMRFDAGARPGFIFALRPSGTIERWMQSPQVNLQQHAHTSLISPQFNLRVALASAPTVERHLRTTMLERTFVEHGHAAADASAGASSGRGHSLSSVAALVEQHYRRVTRPETSGHGRETIRRDVSPPTDFVFRREAQVSEPGRAPTKGHEPPLARAAQAEPRLSPDGARTASSAAAAPRLDVDVLTEQVMQRMQKRLTAQRERMGRA